MPCLSESFFGGEHSSAGDPPIKSVPAKRVFPGLHVTEMCRTLLACRPVAGFVEQLAHCGGGGPCHHHRSPFILASSPPCT